MAHSKQAKKRARQSLDRNTRNRSAKSALRNEAKKLRKLVVEGKKAEAEAQQRVVESAADKTARRGIIHVKTASRLKSRAKAHVAAIGAAK